MPTFISWLWLFAIFLPLILLERWVHTHLQGIWLLIFRNADIAVVIYALMVLPGVLVHELSHWLMATLLGARTGRFSIIPERLPDGTVRLGFVEAQRTDLIREALIGAAPLMVGSALVIGVSYGLLNAGPVGEALVRGDLGGVLQAMQAVWQAPDAWLWLYLIFAISNSMLPSASDRRAWLPLAVFVGLLAALLVYAGFEQLVLDALTGPVDAAIRALATAFTITVIFNVCVLPIIWLLEQGLMKLTGMQVNY